MAPGPRSVPVAERRARLGLQHRLVKPAADGRTVESITDDLVVLHATDPATIYLSVSARLAGTTVEDVDRALFTDRSVLRTLAMRRTLFVTTTAGASSVEGSSSIDVAAKERKRLETFLADSDIDDPPRWLDEAFDQVMDTLDDTGDGLPARDLTKRVPVLATKIVMGAGTKYSVQAGATSRVLGLMAVEGHLVRGRPTGDWTSRTYRWHRRDRWWPDGDGPPQAPPPERASTELLSRWLDRFGPATTDDMKWWTGWTMTKTKRALAAVDTVEVELDGDDGTEVGYLPAADAEPVDEPGPWAALLPSLDPTPMGWKQRSWYLGDHQAELFDRSGNIGPSVWVDGRIVGGWSQRPDGEVVTELLEDVGSEHEALIETEAERVARFVGPVVVKPSFPTPLQKRLSDR